MTETIPHVTINVVTGEATTIQLRPRSPLTVADVEAELAERKAAAKRIDPTTCKVIKYYAKAVDIYDLFEVPDEWRCVGNELFVRNPDSAGPDRYWVWEGDVPEETCKALYQRLGWL